MEPPDGMVREQKGETDTESTRMLHTVVDPRSSGEGRAWKMGTDKQ